MFQRIDPYFAACIATMNEMKHLDLDSKEGKAPGGYNYPLYEIGVPFIFMNAVGTQSDLVTMVHEGGHAIHSFLSRELPLTAFKNVPSEVAELASMSMELLSMNEWNEFYAHDEDLKRAKKEQLESILKILPWIAQIDEFQHWVYENPTHSVSERHEKWLQISSEYGTGLIDWTEFEDMKAVTWQRQLHLFEVPFYYIEYGIAQLGALGVWKNSLSDFNGAIENYKNTLKLGYTKSIPAIYKSAGIEFNFTASYLKELADLCNIQKQLSYHVARHTFATTVTMMNGVPIETVSKMLGHKNIHSTQHYARIVDKKVGDDMKLLAAKLNGSSAIHFNNTSVESIPVI